MKILELTQKNFATVGVTAHLAHQPYPINAKISIGFLILSSYFICNFVFAFCDAKTFTEYTQSIYVTSAVALIIFCAVVLVLNVKKLFKLIKDCEIIVNTSEYEIFATIPVF